MSFSPFKIKFKKDKNKSNSNSGISSNSSNSDSSSFQNKNFNQDFFNNKKNESDSDNDQFNTNTNTKYSSNIETNDFPRNSISKVIKNKELTKTENNENYISKNSSYESKDISNIIEQNNNSFYNFSIFKFLNNPFGFNNNNNNNKDIIVNPSILLKNIQTFIREKFTKPINNWIIKSSSIKILRKIGEGGSSDIFLGLYKGTEIAEKRLHLINTKKNITEFKREVASFVLLQHPYLLLFLGVIAEPKQLSIITEYCRGGNLHELLFKKKSIYLSWKIRKKFLLQIAIGMNFLHTNNPPIIHRDLKSLNIFLTNDMEKNSDITDVKIGDLGLSIAYEKNGSITERVGTCHWMAPEVINNQKYTTKADVYSYGIIIWEVCTREIPYEYYTKDNILFRVSVRKKRPSLKKIPYDTPKKFVELMQKCWDQDPDNRPSFDYIIDYIKNIDV